MRALLALILCVSLGDAQSDRRAASSPETLAVALRERGEYSTAEQLLRATLAGVAVEAEERAIVLNLLGDLMREEGKGAQSRQFFEDALRIPGVSWKRLAESHIGLADLDRDNRLWDDSVVEWNRVARMALDHHAPTLEAVAWRGLGATWLEQGNTARAEPLLRRALAAFESDPGSANQAASTRSYMAQLYLDEDKPALAEDALARALANEERTLGCMHPQVALLLEMMGDAAALRNHAQSARGYYGRALRIMAEKFGENSMVAGAVLANWAMAEQRAGDAARAAEEYQRALAILRTAGRDAHRLRITVMERYAHVLESMHRAREAHALLAEVKSFREE